MNTVFEALQRAMSKYASQRVAIRADILLFGLEVNLSVGGMDFRRWDGS